MKELSAHWTLRRWLSAYLDKELTGGLAERVRAHLLRCQTCQHDLEDIRRGRNLLLHPETLPALVPSASKPSALRIVPGMRWAGIAVLALAILAASVWWSLPSVYAMDVHFYAAQSRMTDGCAYPCISLAETTLKELRRSSPFAVQYPSWLPEGMVLRRVVRYRTPKAEGVGLIFAGNGNQLGVFQQPRELEVRTTGHRTRITRICGRKCSLIDSDRVQLFNWTTGEFCFVVAGTIPRDQVEAVVNSFGDLPE